MLLFVSIRQVTKDDTVAQAMVDDGSITESEIPHIPFKNVLTKAVGTEPEVTAEIQQISFNNDDAFILCSDGLTDSVNSEQWLSIMKPALSTEQQVKNLIGESLKNKANDNVSVMIVRRPS